MNVGQNAGTYMWAMRAFAQCAATQPQAPGYCHGALRSASMLANHDVCEDGSNTNIGFHIRMPFHVRTAGDYVFRIHADYGQGSFMGVDGAEYTPGDLWGHAEIDANTLPAGGTSRAHVLVISTCVGLTLTLSAEHEFDVLGFEACCDGHAEMEVHLPCDKPDDPWRTVVRGENECLECGNGEIDDTCSMDTDSAGCCGASGGHVLCRPHLDDGTCDNDLSQHAGDAISDIIGRFVAVGRSMSQPEAVEYCNTHYAGIASIHSHAEQGHAAAACRAWADPSGAEGTTMGCKIATLSPFVAQSVSLKASPLQAGLGSTTCRPRAVLSGPTKARSITSTGILGSRTGGTAQP